MSQLDPQKIQRMVEAVELVARLLPDGDSAPNPDALRTLIEQCAASPVAQGLPFRGLQHPCEYRSIFFPSELDAGQAAVNTADAITTENEPAILYYEPSREARVRVASLLQQLGLTRGSPRSWYYATLVGQPTVYGFPECNETAIPRPRMLDCDEYPYFASTTSGPGAYLVPTDPIENRAEGRAYGTFVTSCPVVAGDTTNEGEPFLVIPLIGPAAVVPSAHICQQ